MCPAKCSTCGAVLDGGLCPRRADPHHEALTLTTRRTHVLLEEVVGAHRGEISALDGDATTRRA